MDRRQQKTRAAIFQAFGTLLERKSYGGITVQDIIDEANIGRSTFYAHFETKDELLRAMCTDIFHHVFSEELVQEKNHDFSACGQGIEKKITHMLYHLQEKQKNLKGLLSNESGELFMGYLKQYLTEMFSGCIRTKNGSVPQQYILNHAVCCFSETVRWWLTGYPHFTPEEVTAFFFAVMPEGLFL